MKKFRPEVINFRMQLGYPDSDVDKCDGQPVMHLIVLCSEDEERDNELLQDEDVQGMKDVACCYYQRTFYGTESEIIAKMTLLVTEWLLENTQLPIKFGIELISIMVDKYKDLKCRVETNVYINNIGINYISLIPELLKEVNDITDKYLGSIATVENLTSYKHEVLRSLNKYDVDLFPILSAVDNKCNIDFRARDKEVVVKHRKCILQDN